MVSRKKLIVNEVPLKGYMEDAYPLTVAVTKESSYEWIYSNYIQLMFQNPERFDNQPIKFYKLSWNSGLVWDADCPLVKCDTITRQIIEINGLDIIDYICRAICQEYYVKLYLDEYFLPYRGFYKKKHYLHESLFTGYDYDKGELYGLAYVTDNMGYHFKEFAVNMEKIRGAYNNVQSTDSVQRNRIMLMSCNWEKFYEFDLENVRKSIFEYINSISTDEKYSAITNPNREYVFGLEIYDGLISYFDKSKLFQGVIPFHIILEHKELMVQRIKYMMDNQFIEVNKELLYEFEKLVSEANVCKMLFIKYQYTKNKKSKMKVIDSLLTLKADDKRNMAQLYELLAHNRKLEGQKGLKSRWGLWRDIAYNLQQALCKMCEISFQLHVISNKPRGYIRFTNKVQVVDFCAPIGLWFDASKQQFSVNEGYVLPGIHFKSNTVYYVKFIIDMDKKIYSVNITDGNEVCNCGGLGWEDEIRYIDQMIVIHDNSYYYFLDKIKIFQENL